MLQDLQAQFQCLYRRGFFPNVESIVTVGEWTIHGQVHERNRFFEAPGDGPQTKCPLVSKVAVLRIILRQRGHQLCSLGPVPLDDQPIGFRVCLCDVERVFFTSQIRPF